MNMHAGRLEPSPAVAIPLSPRAVLGAVVAEVRRTSVRFRLWVLFLLAVLAVFAVAALIALPPGWEVTGTTPQFEWGLFIIGYVFFAIMTSGLCLSASLGTVFGIERFRPLEKRHLVLAILSLCAAFLIIALDLHYPVRMVFGAVLVPSPSSPMWWMGVFYGGYLVFLFIELYATWAHRRRLHQVASLLTTGTAIFAPSTLGAVFGVLSAKPFWNGIFTPVLMISSALLAGAALLGIVFTLVVVFRMTAWERARTLAIPAIRILLGFSLVVVSAILARNMVADLWSTTYGAKEAAEALISGPLAIPFWMRVIVGLAIPFLVVVSPLGRAMKGIVLASVLVLPMVALDRYLFVAAGQVVPISTMAGNVVEGYATYVPSLVEIGVVAGAAAFMALGYTLAERYLDMHEAPEGHPPIPLAKIRASLARRLAARPRAARAPRATVPAGRAPKAPAPVRSTAHTPAVTPAGQGGAK